MNDSLCLQTFGKSDNHAMTITVGVLALQGAFFEHLKLLQIAADRLQTRESQEWSFVEVRTPEQLESCDALIIPGGESTAIALVAARSGMLEPLRDFVKYGRHFNRSTLSLIDCH